MTLFYSIKELMEIQSFSLIDMGSRKMTFVCYSTTKQMKIIAFGSALLVSKTELSLFMNTLRFNIGNLEMVYTDFIFL